MHVLSMNYDQHKDFEFYHKLLDLFKLCHNILAKFAFCNPKNQKKLHTYIPVFLQHLRVNVNQIPLICAIYKDNFKLVSNISNDLMGSFRALIYKEGRQVRFLEFFSSILVIKDTPVHAAQRFVTSFFVSEDLDKTLLYINDDPDPSFKYTPEANNNPTYRDEPIDYHAKLLQVLSKCGLGISGMYVNEAKCQKILPMVKIFEILTISDSPKSQFFNMKLPALEFFYNIYLESEKPNEEVKGYSGLHDYISNQAKTLDEKDSVDETYIKFLKEFLKILLYYCKIYLKTDDAYVQQEDNGPFMQFATSLCHNHLKFTSRLMTSNLLNQIYEFCSMFNCEFEVMLTGKPEENDDPFSGPFIDSRNSMYDDRDFTNEAEESWKNLIENLIYSEKTHTILNYEKKALRLAIYYVADFCEGLTFSSVAKEIINFISGSRNQRVPLDILVQAIQLLCSFIEEPIVEESESSQESESNKQNIQNKFNSFGATNVVLTLLCDPTIEIELFKTLINFAIQLLDGGNITVQAEFYKFFANFPNSEVFFERIHKLILDRIEIVANGPAPVYVKEPVYKDNHDMTKLILRLMQLFCENHNDKLQIYIRYQAHSRNSYDIIRDVIFLLDSLMRKMHLNYFLEISQCFDTLTEFIQGPCKENQENIIDGQFVEIASNLLALDEYRDDVQVYEALKNEKIYDKFVVNHTECLKG